MLILGGGDGGLLKELLELQGDEVPAFVTMVDIDEMVMEACAEYMPSVCGKYLKRENWDGPNYKVINGCAIQFMKDCLVSLLLEIIRKIHWNYCHFRLKVELLTTFLVIWPTRQLQPSRVMMTYGTFWAPFWT